MTAAEFAASLLDDSSYQLNACLADLSEAEADHKANDAMMSCKEIVGHLFEVFQAIRTELNGGKHEWGTFVPPVMGLTDLIAYFQSERAELVKLALANFEEKPHLAKDYLIAHEYYHVGQMVINRLSANPEWNSYSIYNH